MENSPGTVTDLFIYSSENSTAATASFLQMQSICIASQLHGECENIVPIPYPSQAKASSHLNSPPPNTAPSLPINIIFKILLTNLEKSVNLELEQF